MSALRARAFPVLLGALVLPSVGGLRPAFEDHVGTRVETEQRFEMVKSLMQTYSSQGRLLDRQRVNRSSVSLDFEIELKGSRLVMTPQLVLLRGGVQPKRPLFPQTSKWFQVGLDGGIYLHGQERRRTPAHERWKQSASALIELQTETIAPAEIEDLLPDLQRWLRKVNACGSQRRCLLPRPTSTAASSTVAPAVHFTQRRSVESWNAPETVQFTIGLDLSKVFRWLKLSPFHQRSGILEKVARVCKGQSDVYGSLVALAATTLEQAKRYDSGHRCDHPKALMQPYLVRSHWGDMLTVLSPTERERFASDVLKVVAQQGIPLEADAPLWKQNFYDYLKFPETLELSRLVACCAAALPEGSTQIAQEMPTSFEGLRSMARKVLLQRRRVDRRVSSRSCGFHGRTTGARFTARKWLEAALQGQDLMSDHDSEASTKGSLSGMVWKSMGHWRMETDPSKPNYRVVFLECRGKVRKRPCLDVKGKRWSVSSYLKHVAHVAQQFDQPSDAVGRDVSP